VRAVAYHWRVASLHPFVDGNGRASRAAMNAVFVAAGFPPVVIRREDRFRYYAACRVAQLDGNLSPLADIVLLALETELTRALADATSRSARERERRYAEFAAPPRRALVSNAK
jgi:Fic family protein